MTNKPPKPTIQDIMAKAALEQQPCEPLRDCPLEQLHQLLSQTPNAATAPDIAESAKILQFKIKAQRP